MSYVIDYKKKRVTPVPKGDTPLCIFCILNLFGVIVWMPIFGVVFERRHILLEWYFTNFSFVRVIVSKISFNYSLCLYTRDTSRNALVLS